MSKLPGTSKYFTTYREPSWLESNKGKLYRVGAVVYISKELTDKWNVQFIHKECVKGFYIFLPDQYEILREQRIFLPTYEEIPQRKGNNK